MYINHLSKQLTAISSKIDSLSANTESFELKSLSKELSDFSNSFSLYGQNENAELEKLFNALFKIINSNKGLNDKLKLEITTAITNEIIKLLLEK